MSLPQYFSFQKIFQSNGAISGVLWLELIKSFLPNPRISTLLRDRDILGMFNLTTLRNLTILKDLLKLYFSSTSEAGYKIASISLVISDIYVLANPPFILIVASRTFLVISNQQSQEGTGAVNLRHEHFQYPRTWRPAFSVPSGC
jgi:hypothetical protein